ncbi:MAG: type 1 glutamine amidotransferase domain-containing protein [Pseudomonadota bacterium]
MPAIQDAKILILATNGFEQSELETPRDSLRERGAHVDIVAPEGKEIRGWDHEDWGQAVPVDRLLGDAAATDYDALILPGGQINPDVLRLDPDAIALIRDFAAQGKVIAAICHAPWLLIEAGLVKGRRMTAYPSIRTDLGNAGAEVVDAPVVVANGIITSRDPEDLDQFVDKIVEEVEEGRHARAAA